MSKYVLFVLSILIPANAVACEGDSDLRLLVEYMCQYQLVPEFQCVVWLQDLKQGERNKLIIWDSVTNKNNKAGNNGQSR